MKWSYYLMLTLKNIIIDRLKDIKTFKNEIG